MSFFDQIEIIHTKFNSIRLTSFKKLRNYRLSQKHFTIISNNCWGGMVYQAYNLKKQSPTVGTFFYAPEYIVFLQNYKKALNGEIEFIRPEQSRYWEVLRCRKDGCSFPIGVLPGGSEICFLHYKSEDEAQRKWQRRCKRINWDKMIFKFNDQNLCTEKEIVAFDSLDVDNKLLFTCKDWGINKKHYIKIYQFPKNNCIRFSWEPFCDSIYLNLTKMINNL